MNDGKRGITGRTRGYLAKPSTHVGFYVAGIGSVIGGAGGLAKGVADSLFAYGPEILSNLTRGSWQEAAYRTGIAVASALETSAYVTAAGAFVGYAGGSLVTDRLLGYISSFFGSVLRGPRRE